MQRPTLRSTAPRAGAIAFAAVLAAAAGALPAAAGSHNLTISTGDEPIRDCDQVQVWFGDRSDRRPTAKESRHFTLPRGSTPELVMHLTESGGMSLTGWDGKDYEIEACLAAGASSEERAAELLKQVVIDFAGGRLSLRGPHEDDWLVYFIVKVPKDAALDLASSNAPIGLQDVSGRIKATLQNGPISMTRCRGEIDVDAENGPVSVESGGGRQRLTVHNGPLAIALDGRRWDGYGMEAHAENGPLSLKLPDGYESGVSLEMSGHSPWRCNAPGCERSGGIGWDGGPKRLDFGGSHPVIKVSTVNGPVDVQSGTPARTRARI
jgi:hypothetical protein